MSLNSIQQSQLNKDSHYKYKPENISIVSRKQCFFVDKNTALVFLHNGIVKKLQIDKSTIFEQSLTDQGEILLKKIS